MTSITRFSQTLTEQVNRDLAFRLGMAHTQRMIAPIKSYSPEKTFEEVLLNPDTKENALEVVLAPLNNNEPIGYVRDLIAQVNPDYKTTPTSLILHLPYRANFGGNAQTYNPLIIESDYKQGFVHINLEPSIQGGGYTTQFSHTDILVARVIEVTDNDYTPIINSFKGIEIIRAPGLVDHMLNAVVCSSKNPDNSIEVVNTEDLALAKKIRSGFNPNQKGYLTMKTHPGELGIMYGLVAAPRITEEPGDNSAHSVYKLSDAGIEINQTRYNSITNGTIPKFPRWGEEQILAAHLINQFRKNGGWGIARLSRAEAIQALKEGTKNRFQ